MQSYRILIVDDDVIYRKVMASLLTKMGEVLVAGSGEAAIATLRQHPIDIVFSDILMPNGTGIELLEWVRSNTELKIRPPVVLVSGQSLVTNASALEKGAFAVVSKPFRMKVIVDIFARFKELETCRAS